MKDMEEKRVRYLLFRAITKTVQELGVESSGHIALAPSAANLSDVLVLEVLGALVNLASMLDTCGQPLVVSHTFPMLGISSKQVQTCITSLAKRKADMRLVLLVERRLTQVVLDALNIVSPGGNVCNLGSLLQDKICGVEKAEQEVLDLLSEITGLVCHIDNELGTLHEEVSLYVKCDKLGQFHRFNEVLYGYNMVLSSVLLNRALHVEMDVLGKAYGVPDILALRAIRWMLDQDQQKAEQHEEELALNLLGYEELGDEFASVVEQYHCVRGHLESAHHALEKFQELQSELAQQEGDVEGWMGYPCSSA